MDDKDLLKKILSDELTKDEEQALFKHPRVNKRMEDVWNSKLDFSVKDQIDSNRIWQILYNKTFVGSIKKQFNYYRTYSAVASILLLLLVGFSIWQYSTKPQVMYVVSSGTRSIEEVRLPDGTNVKIGAKSKLTYPQNFNSKKRKVILEGQAFFDVAKDASKPFVVETERMEVTALGTSFEVFSFDIENNAETILLSGKVRICTKKQGITSSKEYILTPNHRFSISSCDKISIDAINANKYSAWRSKGYLSFENETLSTIIPRMEKWYNQRIYCDIGSLDEHRFSITIKDEPLEFILQTISKVSPFIFVLEKDGYHLNMNKTEKGNKQ